MTKYEIFEISIESSGIRYGKNILYIFDALCSMPYAVPYGIAFIPLLHKDKVFYATKNDKWQEHDDTYFRFLEIKAYIL